jgi:hypothetical protein
MCIVLTHHSLHILHPNSQNRVSCLKLEEGKKDAASWNIKISTRYWFHYVPLCYFTVRFQLLSKFPMIKYKLPLSYQQSRSLCHRFYCVIRRSRVRNSALSSCSLNFAAVNVWSRYVVMYCRYVTQVLQLTAVQVRIERTLVLAAHQKQITTGAKRKVFRMHDIK